MRSGRCQVWKTFVSGKNGRPGWAASFVRASSSARARSSSRITSQMTQRYAEVVLAALEAADATLAAARGGRPELPR